MRSASALRSFSVLVRGRPSRAGPPPAPALLARALLAEKDARFADAVREKDARLADAVREKDARLAEKDARLADAVREKDARLLEKDALLAEVRASALRSVSLAKHEADIARGVVNARGLLEACISDLMTSLIAANRIDKSAAPTSMSARLALLFEKCPELIAYLETSAANNSVPPDVLLRQAKKLYDVLSERVHAEAADGGILTLPVELFERSGRPTLIAFAALASFAGRDLGLYKFDGSESNVVLGAPPKIGQRPAAASG